MQSVAINQTSATVPAGFYVPVNNGPTTIDRYRRRESVGFGIVQIIVGVVCIALNAVSFGIQNFRGYGGLFHGFWTGALFIATGYLGVSAGKTKTKCKIVAYMVLCIVSSSFAVVLLSIGINGALLASCDHRYCVLSSLEVALEACMAALAIIEGIFGILGAVLCCMAGICCCRKRPEPISLQTNYLPNSSQMMSFPSNQEWQLTHPPTANTQYNQQDDLDVAERMTANPPPYSALMSDQQTPAQQSTPGFVSDTVALLDEQISPLGDLPLNPPTYSLVSTTSRPLSKVEQQNRKK